MTSNNNPYILPTLDIFPALDTRSLALISIITALAVVSRVGLAALPNVKLNSFLTMVSGILAGPKAGFTVGFLSILISDMAFFGLGFWTPITSFFMGLSGLLAGLLWHNRGSLSRFELALGGLLITLFYDIATSILTMIPFVKPETLIYTALVGLFIPCPYPMGPAHELTTALLMGMLSPSIIHVIRGVERGEK